MDSPPVPKPRNAFGSTNDTVKKPIPLPRTKVPASPERVTASDIFRSISSVSKQLSEDVAQKVHSSAKSANEKIEKSFLDGSKFAKGTLEKTITTSRAVRDSVTKSVIEGTRTAGQKLRKSKKSNMSTADGDTQRCMSMPVVDVSLFDNIQFHSPLMDQKRLRDDFSEGPNHDLPSLALNSTRFDDISIFSSNSDSNADTVSNFSYNSTEESKPTSLNLENEQLTYDTPKASRTNSVISCLSAPEIPERRKKRESLDFMHHNSMYENWDLPGDQFSSVTHLDSRPSKSTIIEFDPLNTSTSSSKAKFEGVSNELLLLESFLIGDTYGSIVATTSNESFEDYGETDYFNPPTPPERLDSLFPENDTPPVAEPTTTAKRNSNFYVSSSECVLKPIAEDGTRATNSVMQKFSHMLKRDSVRSKSLKQHLPKLNAVERPPINLLYCSHYSGILTRLVTGGMEDLFKNSQVRYCVLSDQKLMCYTDPTNSILKEAYTLDSVYSVQVVLPLSSSTNNNYCIELMVSTGAARSTPRKVMFSCTSVSERRNWAQKIAEHLTSGFPTKYTAEFTRCGWCFLKEGVSGEWQGAWVMLIRRVLVYCTAKEPAVRSVDLRKTRCVVTQEADEDTKLCCPTDGCSNLLLDCPHATLYLRFPHERELKGWGFMVRLAAHNNGAYIHHQQLTKEDVPTIVDKCISFIYAHGSMTEGIYRRAGSSSVLAQLVTVFRRDAWGVQLSPAVHSEHDVAGVLKRFFRDLPEPLLPAEQHAPLLAACAMKDESERDAAYRRLMSDLPVVVRNTTRKLFAHLQFIHSMAHVNKMNAENLASCWAPTIMPAAMTSDTLQTAWSSKEVYVVRDLIAHFDAIWEPTEAERRREAAVRRVLMRVLSNSVPTAPKAAGDLKAWIYVKDRTTCYQVALTPSKTSADVCIELSEKASIESHLLMLEEVICGDNMRRPIHIDEIVLDVVLRWGYWDEEDRKDSYLLVRENKMLQEIEALKSTTSLVCGELKFANESSKTFKTHMFEFQNGKLSYFKDKQGSHRLEEWNIKDILWYIGHEPKRSPQSRWAITFIPRNNKQKRSKDRHWFGSTIAGAVNEDQLKWITGMMFAEHSTILPTPRLVIT